MSLNISIFNIRMDLLHRCIPFFLFLIIGVNIQVKATNDTLFLRDDKNNSSFIHQQLYMLRDVDGKLTFDSVIHSQNFVKNNQNAVPNLGFTSGNYWFKFTISNGNIVEGRVLEFRYPFFNILNVFIPDKNGVYTVQKVGDHYPFSQRWYPHKNFLFDLTFAANESKTIYAQIICDGEATSFPVKLWTKYDYLRSNYEEHLALGVYYGIVLFAFFLSAFLGLIVQEKSQLYYFLYIVGVGLFQFSLDGLAFEFFWPNNTWLANHVIPMSGSFAIMFLILFAQSLLLTKQFTLIINRILNYILIVDIILFMMSMFNNPFYSWSLKLLNLIGLTANIFILIAAIFTFKKGLNASKYFLIAFLLLILGIIIALLKNFGLIPRIFITEYGIQIGSAIEIIMLSLAVAENVKSLKTAKQRVQAQLLEQLREKYQIQEQANVELERKVIERTAEIQLQKEVIEEKNKDITDSINYAQKIQRAILPLDQEIKASLPESFIFYRPRDIVSGDFYWYSKKGDTIFIAAADCTGHGVPGALMSMIGNSFLNEIVNEYNIFNPAEVLDMLRIKIIKILRQRETHTKDGMDISFCSIDTKNKIITYAGAFNPVYIVTELNTEIEGSIEKYKSNKNISNDLLLIPADRFPIGIIEGRNNDIFTNKMYNYKKNDCLYLFTDGMADQFGGPLQKKYKFKMLKELLLEINHQNMIEQLQSIEQSFVDWKGNLEQVDDILVIGIRL